jgi:hypothetical protein
MPDTKRTGRAEPLDVDKALDAAGFPASFSPPVSAPPAPEDPRMGIPEGWPMAPTLIARILADVGPVLKTQTNRHQDYNFRGIDQVVNAVNTAFKRHRVFPTSKIEHFQLRDAMTTANKPTREATLRVLYRFTAPDGTYVETEVPGEALDTSDKSTPKAMSVALRIALLQMLLLPTDEPTTDHDYLTRDGVGAMSPTVGKFLLDRLAEAPLLEVVSDIRAIISEHSAWDRPVREGEATWAANFADRLSWIIEEAPDHGTVTDIHGVLDAARLLNAANGKGTMVEQLKARWVALSKLYHETLNHVTAQILAARGVDELEIAIGCGYAALEAGSLRVEDLEKAEAVAEERRPKLPEYAPQPDADELDPAAEAADPGYLEDAAAQEHEEAAENLQPPRGTPMPELGTAPLDPTSSASIAEHVQAAEDQHQRNRGDFQEALKAFAIRASQAAIVGVGEVPEVREAAVKYAIVTLLTGDGDEAPPALLFGEHGFQLVEDAIKAAHRREQTIGTVTRRELDERLAAARRDFRDALKSDQ